MFRVDKKNFPYYHTGSFFEQRKGNEMTIQRLSERYLTPSLLETLSNLSDVGHLTRDEMLHIFNQMLKRSPFNNIFVMVDGEESEVVGAVTLIIEQKFLHLGGIVGHIEDVAVRKGFERKGIGKALIQHAIHIAKIVGCYKVILDCHPENVPFYEKSGMCQNGEVCMRIDLK